MTTEVATRTPADRKPFSDTAHLKADLKGRSVRGGAATLAGQAASFVVHTASTVILARLLTPADFGLIAMVTAVTGFGALFKDLGLSMATIQKAEITHEQVSTLFWVNVGFSALVAVVLAALAPVIGWFYGDPRLVPITLALSFVFVFGGLTVQHQALLRRQMRFTVLAIIPIVAMAAGVLAAIISAALGLGYWALVVMELVRPLTNAAGVWIASPWWPGLPQRRAGVRAMLAFGAHLTGFNILNYFARNLDQVLIGKVWGAGSLGLYTKAYALLMLPITQITAPVAAVAIPALSRLQNDPDEYTQYYYRAINVIAWITMPMVLLLAALSKEITMVILGDQWIDAAPIFKVLAFAALLQPVVNPVGWVFISLGQTNRQLRWAVVAVPLIVLSFVVGLPWGVLGVAVSYTVCNLTALTFPALWWAFRSSPLCVGKWFGSVRCPLCASLATYVVIVVTRGYLVSYGPILTVLISCITAVACFLLYITIWKEAREQIYAVCRMVRFLR